jgi:NAD-dependent SIR2 family protein deacetylase
MLERIAGIDPEKLVEAHGSFAAAHCIVCRDESPVVRLFSFFLLSPLSGLCSE